MPRFDLSLYLVLDPDQSERSAEHYHRNCTVFIL